MAAEENKSPDPERVRVVDRRGFTSTGDPRTPDAVAEETPHITLDGKTPPPPPGKSNPERGKVDAGGGQGTTDGASTSLHFQSLIVNLARQAAANLGAAKNPITGKVEVDIEGAQQMIDLLQALRLKTKGNLSPEEAELLDGLISELQMQFVTVRSKHPKTQ